MTSLIIGSPDYQLKYDIRENKLRDLSWDELKNSYGKGNKIICPCFKREYIIGSTFISSHINSQKHKKWLEEERNLYDNNIGYSGNIENQVDALYKQQREHKVMYHRLSDCKKITENKLEDSINKINILERENEILKKIILEKKIMNTKNLRNFHINNEILITEIKELECNNNNNNNNKIIINDKLENKTKRFNAKNILANFKIK